jgi:hypothetical protein
MKKINYLALTLFISINLSGLAQKKLKRDSEIPINNVWMHAGRLL